jgi:hypothetical protein
VTFGGAATQTVGSGGGNPETAQAYDPISGGGDACRASTKETAPSTAYYDAPAAAGYTLLGRPTITAKVRETGSDGQLAARLWDVAPGGSQILVTRGVYRLPAGTAGDIAFQLNGNGYRFAAGHVPRLELLGRDAPYYRASNGSFSVAVSKLRIVLPVAERPGTVAGVTAPPGALQRLGGKRARLTLRARSRTHRRVRVSGRLIRPKGVSKARGCRGRVTITVKRGKHALRTRRATIRRATCRYARTLRVRKGVSRVTVRARFRGNAALRPAKSKGRRVRIRR